METRSWDDGLRERRVTLLITLAAAVAVFVVRLRGKLLEGSN